MNFVRAGRYIVLTLAVAVAAGAGAESQPAKPATHPLSLDQLTVAGCSFPNFTFEAALRKALELGFAGVEIAVFPEKETTYGETYPWVVVERLSAEEREHLRALVKRFPRVSTHLPFGPEMRPIASDPAIREVSRRELYRALDDSGFWRASVANIHVMSEPGVLYAAARPELVSLYRELGNHAQRLGLRLAIETTRPYGMAEYFDLITAIDHPHVGGTLDTGHIGFFRPELAVEGAARQTLPAPAAIMISSPNLCPGSATNFSTFTSMTCGAWTGVSTSCRVPES